MATCPIQPLLEEDMPPDQIHYGNATFIKGCRPATGHTPNEQRGSLNREPARLRGWAR